MSEREAPLEKAVVLPVALSPFHSFSVSAAIIGNGNIFFNLPFLAISTSTHMEGDGPNRLWISDRGALSLSSQSCIFQATQVGRAFDGIVLLHNGRITVLCFTMGHNHMAGPGIMAKMPAPRAPPAA